MKSLELVQFGIAFLSITMAFLFSVNITMGTLSINPSIMLLLLYATISLVTIDEFVLTWRWKKKYAIPKRDWRERTKLSNYNAFACFLFLIGVVLVIANLASSDALDFNDADPIQVKGTLLDGFTILAVILYCCLRTYLTWKIVPELSYKTLFRTRQFMTVVVVGLAFCFLGSVILSVIHPPDEMSSGIINNLPGFFIPVIVCMFRLATNQELNDRRISPSDQPEISTHPWSSSAQTADVPMWAGETTAWVQPSPQLQPPPSDSFGP